MTKTQTLSIACIAIFVTACSSFKKTQQATIPATPVPASPTIPARPVLTGYIPGDADLAAIQLQYPDASLDQLKQGHLLYTQGACVKCHGPKDIYLIPAGDVKPVIENMSIKARITDEERIAVYRYVVAIKATQPR